jgi:hypothetical protein
MFTGVLVTEPPCTANCMSEFTLVPGNNYRFRVESCYFTDRTWGSCAFFWDGQTEEAGGQWRLLDWKYGLCKSNRRCGFADTHTEVWVPSGGAFPTQHPIFSVSVPRVTISTNGGQTLDNSTDYRRAEWWEFGGCPPGYHPEYPIVTLSGTHVQYQVYTGQAPAPAVQCQGPTTAPQGTNLAAPPKAATLGSNPPALPQLELPDPIGSIGREP